MNAKELNLNKIQNNPEMSFIDRKEVLSMVPLSDRTIYNKEQKGEFPRRFAITSRRVVWDRKEVEDWMSQCKLAGTQLKAPGL